MAIFSNKQSNIKEIWFASFKLYHKAFLQTWYLGMIIGIIVTASAMFHILRSAPATGPNLKILSSVAPLILTLIMFYLTSLILCKIYNIGKEQNISLQDSIAYINKRYIKVLLGMLAISFLYLLGLIALILPGIFMMIIFIAVQPLILLDSRGVLDALKGSYKLVWGNWWRTFAVFFPLMLINIWQVFAVNYLLVQQKWLLVCSDMLISVLFYPFFYVCILVIFNDLKLRKSSKTVIATPLPTATA